MANSVKSAHNPFMGALDEFAPKTENDRRGDISLLFAFAGVIAFLHLLTYGPYGFHREEFQVLSDARHLDWGFVAYPPVTPVLERIGLERFGVSPVGLRALSPCCGAGGTECWRGC